MAEKTEEKKKVSRPRKIDSEANIKKNRLKNDRQATKATIEHRNKAEKRREEFRGAIVEAKNEFLSENPDANQRKELAPLTDRQLETKEAYARATRGALLCFRIGRENRVASDAELKERSEHFFIACQQAEITPTLENYALSIGYTTSWIDSVLNGSVVGFSINTRKILEGVREMIRGIISELALGGQVDKVYAIFYQKNNGGMVDEKKVTFAVDQNQKTADQLIAEAQMLGDVIGTDAEEIDDGQ